MADREVTYTDEAGRKFLVSLPAGAPDSDAPLGAFIGPPSLARLGLPERIEIALHNELFNRGIFRSKDARHRRNEVDAALKAVLRVDTGTIIDLFSIDGEAI